MNKCPCGIEVLFQNLKRDCETYILLHNPNQFVFVYDNKLIHAKDLYRIMKKTNKVHNNQEQMQIEKNSENLMDDKNWINKQSSVDILKLLRLPEMQNSLMIICKASKMYGDCGSSFLCSNHSIIFFPQVKRYPNRNPKPVYKYNVVDWEDQHIEHRTLKKIKEMAFDNDWHLRLPEPRIKKFAIVKNVRILGIKNMFRIYDENNEALQPVKDGKLLQEVSGYIRPLKDSDEIGFGVVCNIWDDSLCEPLQIKLSTEGAFSLFGTDPRSAYIKQNSVDWYAHKMKNWKFDFVLKWILSENCTKWLIVSTLNIDTPDMLPEPGY